MLLLLGACPLHIFVGSLVDLPVLWRQPSLAASTHHPHYPSEEHTKPPPSVSALGGCSRSDADCSTGLIAISTPWVSISLCLWSPHSTSLPAWEFCADCAGGRWAVHESQDFCILSSAAGRISEWPCMQLSLTAHRLCCDPVRSSDWRSLCRAGMRLNPKD